MVLTRRELLSTVTIPFIGRGERGEGWVESLGRSPPTITIFAEYPSPQYRTWAGCKLDHRLVGFEDGCWIFETEEKRLGSVKRVKDIVIKDYRFINLKVIDYFGIITNVLLIRLGVEEYCSHDPSKE